MRVPEQKVELEIQRESLRHPRLQRRNRRGTEVRLRHRDGPTLVWEGLSYSVRHLRVLKPVLDQVGMAVDIRVVTDPFVPRLGSHYFRTPTGRILRRTFPHFDLRPWARQTMPPLVTECDIAVIPIDLADPVAKAKPENKLMLLWRLGMPVITSATSCLSTLHAGGWSRLGVRVDQ